MEAFDIVFTLVAVLGHLADMTYSKKLILLDISEGHIATWSIHEDGSKLTKWNRLGKLFLHSLQLVYLIMRSI